MIPNPVLGVLLHWLGGLASASFYVPYRRVRGWSWETYWLAGGIMSWLIAPWLFAAVFSRHLLTVLALTPVHTLAWVYFFGLLWGLGGLTFGLTMRYLGLSLGMAVALGYTAVFGTLMPPLVRGQFPSLLASTSGQVILVGVAICLVGILVAGLAGISKERELSADQQQADIPEFNLRRGLLIATFCGVMSSCFAFALAAGDPIKRLSVLQGTPILGQGLPVLIVVLAGGLTTNLAWCLLLHLKNRSFREYRAIPPHRLPTPSASASPQLLRNYLFCALAGLTWYLQFFFYTMGETQMGRKFGFSSWTLHMASIIIFSTLWGIALHEWRGVGLRTRILVAATLLILVSSTAVVGYGNLLASR